MKESKELTLIRRYREVINRAALYRMNVDKIKKTKLQLFIENGMPGTKQFEFYFPCINLTDHRFPQIVSLWVGRDALQGPFRSTLTMIEEYMAFQSKMQGICESNARAIKAKLESSWKEGKVYPAPSLTKKEVEKNRELELREGPGNPDGFHGFDFNGGD